MKNLILFISVLLFFASCSAPKSIYDNLTSVDKDQAYVAGFLNSKEPILSPGDKLSISIWGHEDLSIGSINSVYSSNEETGKWIVINDQGEVNLPKVGRVKLAGYTLKESNYILEEAYQVHIKTPIVNVRVLNHYVTGLGEIKNPGKYELDNDDLTLIQFIAQAGGIAEHGNMEEIAVVRTVQGQPTKVEIDLSNAEDFKFHHMILQPDDVIYIAAKSSKSFNSKLKNATPIASIITAIGLFITLL